MRLFVLILFLLPFLIAATCPNDPYKDNCPNECMLISDSGGCTLCVCSSNFKPDGTQSGQNEMLKAKTEVKTKFGYFNATFSWTIEKFQLFNFGTRYAKKILESPVLRAIDQSDGNKVYNAKIKIEPRFQYTMDNDASFFDIKAEFNGSEPRQKHISFTIDNNSTYA